MHKHKAKKRIILHVKSVLGKLAKDLGIGPDDLTYVERRLRSEGITFVTRILPLFSKFAIRCCDEQRVLPRNLLTNFEWSGRSPRFLRGLLEEAISGNPVALRSIRQFCDYFYKTAFGFTRSQLELAEQKYVSVDLSLGTSNNYGQSKGNRPFWEAMRRNLHTIFPISCRITADTAFSQNRPHDGPGSFAGSHRAIADYGAPGEVIKNYPGNVIGSYDRAGEPFSGYFRQWPSAKREKLSRRTRLVSGNKRCLSTEFTADFLWVAKDARGCRGISKEPYFRLKSQMSFNDCFSSLFTRESRHRINFGDQTVNQSLARESSIDRSFATLDLKDASDRVSYALVGHLFQHTSALRTFATRFRSTHVTLPKKGVHRLRKFANMGSGMCFPVLSLVVYLSAVTALTHTLHEPLNKARDMVYVYGDDLIVPTKYYTIVRQGLEDAGLLVNEDKSFSKGYFRESCGGDYYHGIDVGITRLKLTGESLGPVANYRNGFVPVEDDRGVLQLERHARELVDAGLFNTAKYLYKQLHRRITLPSVSRESVVLGVYDPLGLVGITADDSSSGVYVPIPVKASSSELCPYKLMAPFLKSGVSRGTDPYLIPLRYAIRLKKQRETEQVKLTPYGLAENPNDVLNLGSIRTFTR